MRLLLTYRTGIIDAIPKHFNFVLQVTYLVTGGSAFLVGRQKGGPSLLELVAKLDVHVLKLLQLPLPARGVWVAMGRVGHGGGKEERGGTERAKPQGMEEQNSI